MPKLPQPQNNPFAGLILAFNNAKITLSGLILACNHAKSTLQWFYNPFAGLILACNPFAGIILACNPHNTVHNLAKFILSSLLQLNICRNYPSKVYDTTKAPKLTPK